MINVKPGDHEALFAAVQEKRRTGECQEWEYTDAQGVEHGYRWVNDLPLNQSHPELRVNFLEYWEIDGDQPRLFSWITAIKVTRDKVQPLMRGGRARWKVENETFNTLKNQGYHIEHNFGCCALLPTRPRSGLRSQLNAAMLIGSSQACYLPQLRAASSYAPTSRKRSQPGR